tara:strand:- start:261 stop:434 length:174 start_codon:yes stop_codon:yes gene_type:complete
VNKEKVGKKVFYPFLGCCFIFLLFKIFGAESKYLDKAQVLISMGLAFFFIYFPDTVA